jgi:hypothetical protein
MFSMFRKSQSQQPTAAIAQALATDGLPPGMDPATLVVLQHSGSYSGRRVNYFRVFDPVRSAERSVKVKDFADLDAHPELVLGSGHVEQNGAVVLTRQDRAHSSAAFARSEAVRADHNDDERFVFPDKDKAP